MNFLFPTEEDIKNLEPFILKKKNKNVRKLKKKALEWIKVAWENKMDYDVTWFGIPIIQNPYDMIIMQELIFKLKPDVVIETGIAHGGSLLYYASLLELLGRGKVIGIDIDIREHNKKLIEKHPFFKRVTMFEGSSLDKEVIKNVKKIIKPEDIVLVLLDSNHVKSHVYKELSIYKEIVTIYSYIVVFDTFAPNLVSLEGEKPFFKKDNAMNAVKRFIKENCNNFKVDKYYNKFFISSCPNGFLKRIK